MLFLLAGACTPESASTPPAEAPRALVDVQIVARAEAPLAPAAWTAEVRFSVDRPPDPEPVPEGTCRRPEQVHLRGLAPVERVSLTAPDEVALAWREDAGAYVTAGPRRAVDAAWAVGDLRWQIGDTARAAEGVVRFGAPPEVREVEREPEGGVRLRWDYLEGAELLATGPAGTLRCGAGPEGVALPWWAVPARGGSVVLRAARERAVLLEDGTLVRARAVLERVVPLDAPAATTVEAAGPPAPPPTRARPMLAAPRRIARPARVPLG
ncbi:MAG: hypothetical protein ACOZNI_06020 [Myxococcota bacterium]